MLGIRSTAERQAARALAGNSDAVLKPKVFDKALELARVGNSEKVLAQHVNLASSRLRYPGIGTPWEEDVMAIRQAHDALDELSKIEQMPPTTRMAVLQAARELVDGQSSPLNMAVTRDWPRSKDLLTSLQAFDFRIREIGVGGIERRIDGLRSLATDEQRALAAARDEMGPTYAAEIGRASTYA